MGYNKNSLNVVILEPNRHSIETILEGFKGTNYAPDIFRDYVSCSEAIIKNNYCAAILEVVSPRVGDQRIDRWGLFLSEILLKRHSEMPIGLHTSLLQLNNNQILNAIQAKKIIYLQKKLNSEDSLVINHFLNNL